ncbi:RING-H2 finger protein ATL57-like [Coffea eugenioides]|uniref:RING-H2 finger protein ATL57-like n=1 Tax=Coffea eugenioides TaxID=49369 RepID=UPI000F613D2A|nr:RING-H2 finger protein ATL57-like [Coffea eugenioides]
MALEDDVEPASSTHNWYLSDLNLSLQFHNHSLAVIAILVLSIIILITIFFFYFIRQHRQFSSSSGRTSTSAYAAVLGVGGIIGVSMAQNNNNNKGLDEATINSLPVFLHSSLRSTTAMVSSSSSELEGAVGSSSSTSVEEYNNECSICLALFEENERVKVIPGCMHVFHSECVDKWLQNKASCPLCRSNLCPSSSSTTASLLIAA